MIREAEGDAEALLKVKAAEAKGIELIKGAKADNAVLTIKAYEALAKVADGQATKIIVPTNITDLAATILTAAEIARPDAAVKPKKE